MPDAPLLLGCDVGGSGVRCLLVDARDGGRRWISASRALRLRPAAGGLGSELDLEALWRSLGVGVREVLARAGAAPEAVQGVAGTAMRFGTVLLDGDGAVLMAAPNRDVRGSEAAARLAAAHGPALHAETGHWPAPILAAPRLLWLAEHEPDAWSRAAHVLGLGGWLAFRLCGELAWEPSEAAGTLLLDLARRDWSHAWTERLGLPLALFPKLRAAGERLGSLGPEAAAALGLRPGIPVALAGADTQCALLAAAVAAPGEVGIVAGTTSPAQQVVARPQCDPDARLWTEPHGLPDRWVVESNAGPGGESLAWLARLLDPQAAHPVARLLAEAEGSEPGARGLRSTLGAQLMDGRAMDLPVAGLELTHLANPDPHGARADLARAAVEGVAYALRANLERLRAVAGVEHGPPRLAGGLARSPSWTRLLADVLGRPVRVGPAHDASGLGAALCAGVAAELWEDPAGGLAALGLETREQAPDPERAARYDTLFAAWQELRAARGAADALGRQHGLPAVMAQRREAAPAPRAPRPRILVTADADPAGLDALCALGEVEHASFREKLRLLSGPALVEALAGVQVLVTEVDLVDARSLLARPELRVVASCRGDAVNVDVEACTALGVPVLHAPGRNAEAVADLTLAFLLALARRLPEAAAFLRDPSTEAGDLGRMGQAFGALRGHELGGRTVGLVGLGAVGRAVARRLRPFGARVLVADPGIGDEDAARADAERVSLEQLLAESDFVSLHAAVTARSRGLLGRANLARMKPGACLVNTARAALVDETALAEALVSGHLAGAALDVFAVEPPGGDHPLLQLPGVIATPHVGGNTAEVAGHQGRLVADDLARLLAGQRPRHVLNPEVLADFDWSAPRRPVDAATAARLEARPAPSVSDTAAASEGSRRPRRRQAPSAAQAPPETLEAMRRILAGFTEGMARDAALRAFAAEAEVMLHFALTDLPLAFHLELRRGVLSSGLGPPPDDAAEVELRMPADVLDGMFTGRVNPMQEAMGGRLSFSGDTAKAMTLQHLQADLARIYQAARQRAGDPGDLASLSGPAVRPGSAAGPADALREELVRVVDDLYAQELITATGGNVSARIPDRDEIWITPSQMFKGDLRPEVLVRIGLDGRRLDPGAGSPSSERTVHCAIYRAKPEARAVIHAHAPHATILANMDLPFLPISTEAAFFADLARVPFIMPGTDALADAVGEAIAGGWAVLMKNHGLIVAGRTLRRAADMAEIIDRSARVILGCYAVGGPPPTLPDDVVAELRKLGDLVA